MSITKVTFRSIKNSFAVAQTPAAERDRKRVTELRGVQEGLGRSGRIQNG